MSAEDKSVRGGNTWEREVDDDGEFVRRPTTFRSWIRADGSGEFQPERGRYHLYVSYACPWAHRTLIFRKLKGLASSTTACCWPVTRSLSRCFQSSCGKIAYRRWPKVRRTCPPIDAPLPIRPAGSTSMTIHDSGSAASH